MVRASLLLGHRAIPHLTPVLHPIAHDTISIKPISDIIKIGDFLPKDLVLWYSNENVKFGHRTWTPYLIIFHFNFWQPIAILKYKQTQRQNIFSSCLSAFTIAVIILGFYCVQNKTYQLILCRSRPELNLCSLCYFLNIFFILLLWFYKSLPFPKSCPGVCVCQKY